jgi:hypothetical protein
MLLADLGTMQGTRCARLVLFTALLLVGLPGFVRHAWAQG